MTISLDAASSADSFDIALGDTVEPGVPGPGAGNIESPGAQDVYRFAGASGQTVVLDVIEPSLQSNPDFEGILVWTMENPDGETILEGQMYDLGFGIPSPETVLGQTGEFRLVVGAIEGMETTGTYSFEIAAN